MNTPDKKGLDKLECDHCGDFICYVHAGDLNGNYFFCKKCVDEKIGTKEINGFALMTLDNKLISKEETEKGTLFTTDEDTAMEFMEELNEEEKDTHKVVKAKLILTE